MMNRVFPGARWSQQQFIQQQQASRDLLVSNQVSKGFEQLGQAGIDKVVVRLGGIYALEGVMNTSEQYHRPVLEALSAFVRDSTRTETGDGPPGYRYPSCAHRDREAHRNWNGDPQFS